MKCASNRGTDSHSIYNWAENMRYWSTDFDVPFPGSDGAKVHTGMPCPRAGTVSSYASPALCRLLH